MKGISSVRFLTLNLVGCPSIDSNRTFSSNSTQVVIKLSPIFARLHLLDYSQVKGNQSPQLLHLVLG